MMYGRSGLDRFKKAQALEPFSVTPVKSSPKAQASANAVVAVNSAHSKQSQDHQYSLQKVASDSVASSSTALPAPHATQVGGGQSTWQPPDWAIEPRQGVYYLEVMKDGEVLDTVSLDKRRHIFGRQFHTCDFVLDHQSVSRQHAAVIPHKSGSVYVIDLGSAHGTFVANERLTKDTPVELEVGQSLRFAASTRTYILRKNNSALFTPVPPPTEIELPPLPDPSDEEAVVAYNTVLNRYGLSDRHTEISSGNAVADAAAVSGSSTFSAGSKNEEHLLPVERAAKRAKKMRVAFRDQVGGELVEVVGISDGADVETEPGPVGVKEGGSLVGKYESLVQVTMIPKGQKEQSSSSAAATKDDSVSQKGVTDKLKQVLSKVKSTPKSGIYDDLYGESFSGAVGSSWARPSSPSKIGGSSSHQKKAVDSSSSSSSAKEGDDKRHEEDNKEEDDLFGD